MPGKRMIAFCIVAVGSLGTLAQSTAARQTPAPVTSLEQLILQSRTAEALEQAAKAPHSVLAAAKQILAASDQDVTDQKPDDAAAKLDALSRFLDACAEVNKGLDVPREGLKGRQLRVQGIRLSNRKEPAKAEPVLREALELARKAGDTFLEAGVHNNLGYALLGLAEEDEKGADNRLEEAVKEFEQARSLAASQEDPFRAASYGFNLGQAQLRLRRFEEAAAAFKLAAGNFLVAGRKSLEARALLHQGIALSGADPASEEPLGLFEEASRVFEKLGEDRYTGWSLFLVSEALARSQRFAEAAKSAEQAVPLLSKTGPKDRLAACYFLLSEIHTTLGNSQRAEQYRQLLRDLGLPE